MVITYNIKNSLYLNITNHCTNRCDFCIRDHGTGLFASLKLEREPTLDEILDDVLSQNLHKYKEIVFCGYGEPTCRLYDLLAVCKKLRETTDTPIRLNTNGHASLISGEDTAPMFKGLVDVVSISMNAAVLKFAREISKYVPSVVLTAVENTIQPDDVDRCRRIAADLGAEFRLREYI